tara:strand:- start:1073 stop:2347 length:1275 start_codon:yes stop_codon:yes gene_type:complete
MSLRKISVVGLGYIGLPTAALFASRKIEVSGIDVNQDVVNTINDGEIHIVEPGLDVLIKAVVSDGYLKANTIAKPADAFIIAVPTPINNDKQADTSFVQAAIKKIAPVLKKGDLVVLESTCPVGTTELVCEWLRAERKDLIFPKRNTEKSDIHVAYCPERVLPGNVLHELINNDRVVGGMTSECANLAVSLYKIFLNSECIITDVRTAEMCKLTENAFRDVNIAFANELSLICDDLSINVWELIKLASCHPRVNILKPGPGVGGHCIAVDPWFIATKSPKEAKLIRQARQVNENKPEWVILKIRKAIEEFLRVNKDADLKEEDVTIACFGLAFKPDIDDLRESPALMIANEISNIFMGQVLAVEPNLSMAPESLNSSATFCDHETALQHAQIKIILVAHSQFKAIQKTEWGNFDCVIDFCGALE